MSDRTRFWTFALGAFLVFVFSPMTEWGDSLHYSLVIERGGPANIFESAHLLWRPVGWVLWHLARMANPAARPFEPLRLLSVVLSALGVGVVAVWLGRRFPEPVASLGAVVFALGYAFWSYATTACAYTAATSVSLAAVVIVWPEKDREVRTGALYAAALLQALATALWLPMLFNTPAVMLAAGLGLGAGGARFDSGRAVRCGAAAGALVLAIFAASWLVFVQGSGVALRAWLTTGQHGHAFTVSVLDAARAAYGWTRLLWQAWIVAPDPDVHDGIGRILTWRTLWEWGMWKPAGAAALGLLALGAGAWAIPRERGATWLILLLWALPSAVFALGFKGSDPERWLPAWGAVLWGALAWALGTSPGRTRLLATAGALALIVAVGAADRFGPHGNVENRPQMRLIRAAAPYVHPGDIVYLGGEMDESQLNRTVQTVWGVQWIYFTGAGAMDAWTWPLDRFMWGEMKYSPTGGQTGRSYIAESVLGGIPAGAPHVEGAEDRRIGLLQRLKPGPFTAAFHADGIRFFELLPESSSAPAR